MQFIKKTDLINVNKILINILPQDFNNHPIFALH